MKFPTPLGATSSTLPIHGQYALGWCRFRGVDKFVRWRGGSILTRGMQMVILCVVMLDLECVVYSQAGETEGST